MLTVTNANILNLYKINMEHKHSNPTKKNQALVL